MGCGTSLSSAMRGTSRSSRQASSRSRWSCHSNPATSTWPSRFGRAHTCRGCQATRWWTAVCFARSAPGGRFELDADQFEIPTFANAEGLVERLVRREIVVLDDVVENELPGVGVRTHGSAKVPVDDGLSPKELAQIQRARSAVHLLEAGWSPDLFAEDLRAFDRKLDA